MGFLVTPYIVLMPIYAKNIFGGDARTFGTLISSTGAGSLMAGLYLARRTSTMGLRRKVSIASVVSGAALAVFALNGSLDFAYPILMALGFSMIVAVAGGNTMIQTWVRDDMRGRVMATFSMAFLGTAPSRKSRRRKPRACCRGQADSSCLGVLAMLIGLVHAYRLRRKELLAGA